MKRYLNLPMIFFFQFWKIICNTYFNISSTSIYKINVCHLHHHLHLRVIQIISYVFCQFQCNSINLLRYSCLYLGSHPRSSTKYLCPIHFRNCNLTKGWSCLHAAMDVATTKTTWRDPSKCVFTFCHFQALYVLCSCSCCQTFSVTPSFS